MIYTAENGDKIEISKPGGLHRLVKTMTKGQLAGRFYRACNTGGMASMSGQKRGRST